MLDLEKVHHSAIHPAEWRSTHTLKPDLKTIATSITEHGWLCPLVAHRATGDIIDGYHRWGLAQTVTKISKRDKGFVPVTYVDCDEIDARILHVQMNRGRGTVVPRYLTLLVKDVLRSKKYDERELKLLLGMGIDEFSLLLDGTILKQRKIAEYSFSKAWIPIEGNGPDSPTFERPPNKDH